VLLVQDQHKFKLGCTWSLSDVLSC